MSASSPLRVGVVHYLNAWPLAWGLWHPERLRAAGRAAGEVAAEDLSPAALADRLRAGTLDVGLLPTIELQRIPGLSIVPGLGIAATEEVRSVLLVSRCAPREIGSVAVDENSRTSVALLRLVLAERHGVSPRFFPAAPRVEEMLDAHDAALVIGDPALHVDRARYRVTDLAAEWKALTGLPFVFAVWAVAPSCRHSRVADLLTASYESGRADLERIVVEASDASGLSAEVMRTYFTANLRYELGLAELAGIAEFHRRAARHDLTPGLAEVPLWRPPSPA